CERGREERMEAVATLGGRQDQTVPPFAFMSICDRPELQLAAAQSFAWPEIKANAEPIRASAEALSARRLRLGFVSTAFHEHPVPRLVVDVLGRLDRQRFEIYAYALGGASDEMRARVIAVADAFRETKGMASGDIARLIRADGIAVLFDLSGQTEFARPDLFAARPAPLQINYLGYAGTLGAPY